MEENSRQVVMAANWKMNHDLVSAVAFMNKIKPLVRQAQCQIIVFPPAILIPDVVAETHESKITVGAQNIHWEKTGAYTGEISVGMIKEAGCRYCLCGHSERRHYFDESSDMITRKVQAAFAQGIIPILCVGETLEQRQNGETMEFLNDDLHACLAGVAPNEELIIAYEPVWAIGTGVVASMQDAEEAIAYIRCVLREMWDEAADQIRILYGGSVRPDNISQLMQCPNIDGALVGGASLQADSFAAIVNY